MRHPFFTLFIGFGMSVCLMGSAVGQTPGLSPGESSLPATQDLSCPLASNCVNSFSSGGLLPLRYAGEPAQGMALLLTTLALYPEAKVMSSGPLRLQVIFTTPLGFRDQVDFVVDEQANQIAYRSRSLVGLFDFGKNRSRMTEFAQRFAAGAR